MALVVVLGTLQLVRVPHENPPSEGELVAPTEVANALKAACYDCHSNRTEWPWYSHIAPLAWLIAHDVGDGRKRLNFSEWARYAEDPETEARKLEEIARSVTLGEMAPGYYLWLHPRARLDKAEREIIRAWALQQSEPRTPAS